MSGGPADLLAEARSDLGLSGRPNKITRDYARRHGDAFLRAPWCDMGVTYWVRRSGTADAVLPRGDRAYTPWHADDFRDLGQWHSGTAANLDRHARPGDIVFFDWGGTNSIGRIDHVGVIERVLGGGRVQTIEANTGDAVRRRVRGAGVIAGFGSPEWAPYKWDGKAPTEFLEKGDVGRPVRGLQHALLTVGEKLPKFGPDGDFGGETETAVESFQRRHGLVVDGQYGDHTERELRNQFAARDDRLSDEQADDGQEDEDMKFYYDGQLSEKNVTSVCVHAGSITWAGFNVGADQPPTRLLVTASYSDGTASEAQEVTALPIGGGTRKATVKLVAEDKLVDGFSVERFDGGAVSVGWDAT